MRARQQSVLRRRLHTAACALLLSGIPPAARAGVPPTWQLDATGLLYSERSRTRVFEPTARITRFYGDGSSLSATVAFDAITGATPSGAAPSGKVQTTTTPSGNVSTLPASQVPTGSFHDVRGALDLDWLRPLGAHLTTESGGHVSREKDYQSFGATGKISLDFMQKLTTLTLGGGVNRDQVMPTGGVPLPLSQGIQRPTHHGDDGRGEDDRFAPQSAGTAASPAILPAEAAATGGSIGSSRPKQVNTWLVGLSRILTRRWMLGMNFSRSRESGYLTEPYKVVSLVDPQTGYTTGQLTEARPDRRNRSDVLGSSVYHLTRDVLYTSYRYYWDDWGVRSNTFDLKYRHELTNDRYLQPHVRYYLQSRARFFTLGLPNNTPLPEFASSDYRLGRLSTITLGATYGFRFPDHPGEWSVRAEYIRQAGQSYPSDAVGVQRTFDQMPPVQTTSLTVAYTLEF